MGSNQANRLSFQDNIQNIDLFFAPRDALLPLKLHLYRDKECRKPIDSVRNFSVNEIFQDVEMLFHEENLGITGIGRISLHFIKFAWCNRQ
jgi:hypothetical protein